MKNYSVLLFLTLIFNTSLVLKGVLDSGQQNVLKKIQKTIDRGNVNEFKNYFFPPSRDIFRNLQNATFSSRLLAHAELRAEQELQEKSSLYFLFKGCEYSVYFYWISLMSGLSLSESNYGFSETWFVQNLAAPVLLMVTYDTAEKLQIKIFPKKIMSAILWKILYARNPSEYKAFSKLFQLKSFAEDSVSTVLFPIMTLTATACFKKIFPFG